MNTPSLGRKNMAERPRFSNACGFTAALAASMAVFTAPVLADNCTKLSSVALPEVVSITASSIAANSFTPPGLTAPVPVAFCRVQITVTPAINIEVSLPTPGNWNHRFQAEGGGGYAGVISYSALAMAVTGDAVTGQFATASTDTGHPATGTANGQGGANGAQAGGGFALNLANDTLNEELIVDFASRSLHEMAAKAKAVIKAYYGKPQDYAYWNGCSTGGRQGWIEAQRFPEDYDGILAGAPAFNWDRFIPAELWPMNLDVGAPVSQSKLTAVTAAAIKACDGLDGVIDGVINDPRQCRFDPHVLVRMSWYAADPARQPTVPASPVRRPTQHSKSGAARVARMASSCGTASSRVHPLRAWQTRHPARRRPLCLSRSRSIIGASGSSRTRASTGRR